MYLIFMTPQCAATDGIPPVANEKKETGTHQQLVLHNYNLLSWDSTHFTHPF